MTGADGARRRLPDRPRLLAGQPADPRRRGHRRAARARSRRGGVIVEILPCPAAATTAPGAIAAAIAQQNAEVLAGARPRAARRARHARLLRAAPERRRPAQRRRSSRARPRRASPRSPPCCWRARYGLACDCYGPSSDSKVVDTQFGYEHALNAMLGHARPAAPALGHRRDPGRRGQQPRAPRRRRRGPQQRFYALERAAVGRGRPRRRGHGRGRALGPRLPGHEAHAALHPQRARAPAAQLPRRPRRVARRGPPRPRRPGRARRSPASSSASRVGLPDDVLQTLCELIDRARPARSASASGPTRGASWRRTSQGREHPVRPRPGHAAPIASSGAPSARRRASRCAASVAFFVEHFTAMTGGRLTFAEAEREAPAYLRARARAGCRSASRSSRAWPRAPGVPFAKLLVLNCAEEFTSSEPVRGEAPLAAAEPPAATPVRRRDHCTRRRRRRRRAPRRRPQHGLVRDRRRQQRALRPHRARRHARHGHRRRALPAHARHELARRRQREQLGALHRQPGRRAERLRAPLGRSRPPTARGGAGRAACCAARARGTNHFLADTRGQAVGHRDVGRRRAPSWTAPTTATWRTPTTTPPPEMAAVRRR